MQGCGQAVTDNLLFMKIAEHRMQFLEAGKIIEDRFDNCVDDLVRHIGRGDDSGTDAKGSGIVWLSGIHAVEDSGHAVEGIVSHQPVNRCAADGYQFDITA